MAKSRITLFAACFISAASAQAEGWASLEGDAAATPPSKTIQLAQSEAAQPATQAQQSSSGALQVLYEEMEILKQEVQTLRGIVEEQTYELNKLKKEQKERYIELDRRMSQVIQGGGTEASLSASAAQGEKERYDAAFKLIKEKKLSESLLALQAFLTDFPKSALAVNAYYWTGQIYYIQGQLDDARKAFIVVVNQYPEHQKTADSKLKLGKVYHQLGEEAKAKEMLRMVIDDYAKTSPGTARLAENYLNQHFK